MVNQVFFPGLGLGFTLDRVAFHVLGRPVYWYGIIIASGLLLAVWLCCKWGKRFGITEDQITDMMLFAVPAALVCIRAYYVIFNLGQYRNADGSMNWAAVFRYSDGGLAIYGGIIAGALVVYFVCRKKKVPVPAFLDLVVFGLLIGQIVGRWGNFMNREAFGAETDIFCRMGLIAPDGSTIYVHPTFLYESLWNLGVLIFLIVFTKKGKRRYDGQCLLLYFLLYGLGRAWIEGLRTDSLYIGDTGIRVSQALSLALVLVSLVILIIQSRRPHPPEKLFVNQVRSREEAAAAEAAAADKEEKEIQS